MFSLSCRADCTAQHINHPHAALRLANASSGSPRGILGVVVFAAAAACQLGRDKTTAPRMPRAALGR